MSEPDGTRADAGRYPFDPLYCGQGCQGEIGETYCSSFPNYTGAIAQTHILGSTDLADDLLIVSATDVPPQVPGLMAASRTPGFIPFFAGSEGALCVGGQLLRFESAPVFSGPAGAFALQVELGALPLGQAVLAGDLRHFQYWFRDISACGPTSNTTSASRVQF